MARSLIDLDNDLKKLEAKLGTDIEETLKELKNNFINEVEAKLNKLMAELKPPIKHNNKLPDTNEGDDN